MCGAPGYLGGERPNRPDDLARHNCLLYTGSMWQEEWPFTHNDSSSKVRLSGNIRSNDNLYLCRAAAEGAGLTVQPSFNIWRKVRSGRLEIVLNEWAVEELGVYVVFPHRQYLPSKTRAFIDFLAARFRNSPDRDIWLEKARA